MEREAFLEALAKIPEEKRVWSDETGMDGDESYPYGWAPKGKRCEAMKPGKSAERVNVVAGLKGGRLLAPFVFTGYCDAAFFNRWLEEALIPELTPGDTVILDNAAFHKPETIRKLLTAAGCDVLFTPRYSPQDNEIEHRWFPLKNAARKILQTFIDPKAALEAAILCL